MLLGCFWLHDNDAHIHIVLLVYNEFQTVLSFLHINHLQCVQSARFSGKKTTNNVSLTKATGFPPANSLLLVSICPKSCYFNICFSLYLSLCSVRRFGDPVE